MNRHYIVSVESKVDNYVHNFVDGKEAVILEANCGEHAWFTYKLPEDKMFPWHRVCTSIVQETQDTPESFKIITENSIYTFVEK